MTADALYFRYWGKASPQGDEPCHLLAFHALDVAACGAALLKLPQYALTGLSRELGWPLPVVESLALFFLVLHDIGKFSRGFQGLAPGLSPDLVQNDALMPYRYRHDTLGLLLWTDGGVREALADRFARVDDSFWADWMKTAVGHHGKPPLERSADGMSSLDVHEHFLPADLEAVIGFVREVLALGLLPTDIPEPRRELRHTLRRHAWRLAGLAVLADWIGSNQQAFRYVSRPQSLATYWREQAQPRAEEAVRRAGLAPQRVREWADPRAMFDYLREPTPLQSYAAQVPLQAGPQLFMLEDVTGAGKTEAALILVQRLMQARLAAGFYFALPSMATANQMYQRVGTVYRSFFTEQARPSLVLSHGARNLVAGFRQSVLPADRPDGDYANDDQTASTQCSAWLADSRKKALLADVGVGSVDQALLAVLPVRHQSLRLLGLASKVLVVDEVHAYDSYMRTLLCRLLTAQARQGGSAILLSATLPADLREALLRAYRKGLGVADSTIPPDARYPLATHVAAQIVTHACDTRPQLVQRVRIRPVHDEADALRVVLEEASLGRSVCWIRNTVDDACRAYDALLDQMPAERLTLFHARFAMGDRLDIEAHVLRMFGKASGPAMRHGRVLIGTQVLEQSLDFDVDVMVSDLAPVDVVIQRAGRLQRHARMPDGGLAADGVERRPAPVLYLLCPLPDDAPAATWYEALFPKASAVYPDVGALWRTARVLLRDGCIFSPGTPGEPGAVRSLVEAVYGEDAEPIPDALERATTEAIGKALSHASQANFNALELERGYCWGSGDPQWAGDMEVPTRLGDETRTLYLAVEREGRLVPWRDEADGQAWEQSAVRVDARKVAGLPAAVVDQWREELERCVAEQPMLQAPAVIVPLRREAGGWSASIIDGHGRDAVCWYDVVRGVSVGNCE